MEHTIRTPVEDLGVCTRKFQADIYRMDIAKPLDFVRNIRAGLHTLPCERYSLHFGIKGQAVTRDTYSQTKILFQKSIICTQIDEGRYISMDISDVY